MAKFQGMSDADKLNDIQILNRALFFENRGVWAYNFAADKLSTSQVGKTVLELALQNRADHEKHQDMLRLQRRFFPIRWIIEISVGRIRTIF
jgi:hypothetical protein